MHRALPDGMNKGVSTMFIRWVFCGALVSAMAFSEDRDLNRGRGEVRGFSGFSFGASRGLMDTVAPTAGAEVALGVNRLLAVTGGIREQQPRDVQRPAA